MSNQSPPGGQGAWSRRGEGRGRAPRAWRWKSTYTHVRDMSMPRPHWLAVEGGRAMWPVTVKVSRVRTGAPSGGDGGDGGGEGPGGSPMGLPGRPRGLGALGEVGGVCGPGGRFGFRESIFKIGHSKSRKKVQNPDPRSYVARGSLHLARGVYEGSRAAPKAARPTALGEDVRVTPGRLSRRSESCHHSIHTAPLLRSSLRSAGGSAASGACLTRSTLRLRPEGGEGGYKRGRGRCPRPRRLGFVGDWALPTTIS